MKIASACSCRSFVMSGALVLSLVLGPAAAAPANDPLPKPLPASRFDKLAANSPFSPPTAISAPAPTPPPPPQPGFADKYTLAAIMQQGDDFIATLNNKETSDHVRVGKKRTDLNQEGIKIASVVWGRDGAPTRVTLEKNQQFGEVTFDPNNAQASSTSPTGAVIPGAAVPRLGMRPVPPLPAAIRPPPGSSPLRQIPGAVAPASPNAVRRPNIIRAPNAQVAPRPNNPGVNFPAAPRPVGRPTADDGDDDDDE